MTDPRLSGATAATGESKKRPIWLWILLGLVILGLLIWWLVAALTDDDDGDVSTDASSSVEQTTETETSTATATPTDTAAPETTPTAGEGVLLVGDVDAFAPGTDLSLTIGDPAVANSVQIAAVVADEAFFVGPGPGQTVLVRLQPFGGADDPESPGTYEVGDTVSFSGTVREIDQTFLDELKLFTPSAELQTGDVYVQVDEIILEG